MAWNAYDPFPTSGLGRGIGMPVQQHAVNTGVAVELIAPIALAVSGIPVSDLFDVVRPNCAPSPTCINVCVVAGSGEGKDTAAAPFITAVQSFQQVENDESHLLKAAYDAELRVWRLKERHIVRDIAKAIEEGRPLASLQFDLAVHMSAKPRPPQRTNTLFSDTTRAAISQSLCHTPRSVALYSMEAGRFFNGPLFSDMPFWNDVWSGTAIYSETITHGSVEALDPRVSMILGIQQEPYARFLRRCGVEAHDSGFTARFLTSVPPSTKGLRFITGEQQDIQYLEEFRARITTLMNEAALRRREGRPRRRIEFTPSAARYFVAIYNNLQVLMRPGNPYADISGQAAKAAENVARIAAILHVIDDLPGLLDEETLYRAGAIVEWHVNQFMRMVQSSLPQARTYRDAESLWHALVYARRLGHESVARKDLRFWMPADLTTVRLGKAFQLLVSSGQVKVTQVRGKEFVSVAVAPALPVAPGV